MLQALQKADCLTTEIDEARLIYVDLYCPYIKWLGYVHSKYAYDVWDEDLIPTKDILKVSIGMLKPSQYVPGQKIS